MEFTYIDKVFEANTPYVANSMVKSINIEEPMNNIRISDNYIPKGYIYELNSTYFGPFSSTEPEIKVKYTH